MIRPKARHQFVSALRHEFVCVPSLWIFFFRRQYKVDAPTLKAWVQILMAVEGSIMWLVSALLCVF